jgi:hypothetical protein
VEAVAYFHASQTLIHSTDELAAQLTFGGLSQLVTRLHGCSIFIVALPGPFRFFRSHGGYSKSLNGRAASLPRPIQ